MLDGNFDDQTNPPDCGVTKFLSQPADYTHYPPPSLSSKCPQTHPLVGISRTGKTLICNCIVVLKHHCTVQECNQPKNLSENHQKCFAVCGQCTICCIDLYWLQWALRCNDLKGWIRTDPSEKSVGGPLPNARKLSSKICQWMSVSVSVPIFVCF